MGAWSHDAFGNDDALDFLEELNGARSWGSVRDSLSAALEQRDYLEAPGASQAVAAAAMVAIASGFAADLPESYAQLPNLLGAPPAGLANLAAQTISRVTGANSELAELWAEGSDTSWIDYMDDLQNALMGPPHA